MLKKERSIDAIQIRPTSKLEKLADKMRRYTSFNCGGQTTFAGMLELEGDRGADVLPRASGARGPTSDVNNLNSTTTTSYTPPSMGAHIHKFTTFGNHCL